MKMIKTQFWKENQMATKYFLKALGSKYGERFFILFDRGRLIPYSSRTISLFSDLPDNG